MWNTDLSMMPVDTPCLLLYKMKDTFAPSTIILVGDKIWFRDKHWVQPFGYLWSKTVEYKEHYEELDAAGTPVPFAWKLIDAVASKALGPLAKGDGDASLR